MCKIAIITYYRNGNYGSALQSYALQTIIKDMGYQCENIRYGSKFSSRLVSVIKNPSKILKKLSRTRLPTAYYRIMDFVNQYIDESNDLYKSIAELKLTNEIYDVFICGSDQVWAPNHFNEWYYISFIDEKHKKVAYAPSIGLSVIPNNLKSHIASLLRGIKYLSVREKQGENIIYELTGIHAPVVLDPTLLINRNRWISTATETNIEEPYILCYFLGSNVKHRDLVEKYKQKTGDKTVVIVPPFSVRDYSRGDITLKDVGPLEFVGLVNNARIIFTDSLHGALFSINLNRPFNVFMRFTEDHILCQNSRIVNILDMFGLSHRLIKDDALEIKNDSDIDYESVNKILESKRKYSIDYLKTSLEESISRSEKNKHV